MKAQEPQSLNSWEEQVHVIIYLKGSRGGIT